MLYYLIDCFVSPLLSMLIAMFVDFKKTRKHVISISFAKVIRNYYSTKQNE